MKYKAGWICFEGRACRLIERGTGKRDGQLLVNVGGWPAWVPADRCYPV